MLKKFLLFTLSLLLTHGLFACSPEEPPTALEDTTERIDVLVSTPPSDTDSHPKESPPQAPTTSEEAEEPPTPHTTGGDKVDILLNTTVLTATLEDNSSARAFAELLRQGEITVSMHDYGNFEKVGDLPTTLPRNDESITTRPGDIILYQGNQITLYYDTNTWSFTRLGSIEGATKESLIALLGEGNVTVTFRLHREEPQIENRILIAYFSATGNTEGIARQLRELTHGDLYEILLSEPYSETDLAYYTDCRANREQRDPSARPGISGKVSNMEAYDTILLGYPIWHGQAPRIISTFLESYDLSGKTIVPFCTSHSSGIGSSDRDLHPLAQTAIWLQGKRFPPNIPTEELQTWLEVAMP